MDSQQRQQIVGLLGKRAGEVKNPRKLPDSEIEQLLQAAALIGNGRAAGATDEQIIGQFARKLLRERDNRVGAVEYRAQEAEKDLIGRGLAEDDIPVKNNAEMLQDEKVFGFYDEADAAAAEDGEFRRDRQENFRKQLRDARQMRSGERKEARLQKIQERMRDAAEEQKVFDFGLIPIVGEDEDPINQRERGRFVREGDQVFFKQGNQRIAWDGQRDEVGEPILPEGVRMNPDVAVVGDGAEIARLVQQDAAMGQSAVREFERFERGDLRDSEIENIARLRAGLDVQGSPDEAKAAIIQQLQNRREENRGGRLDRIRAMQQLDNLDEAQRILAENAMPGAPVGPGVQIAALGQIKGDKLKADMGLKLGNQKATPENAIRIQRTDGSYEFVDRAGNSLAAPTEKVAQSINISEFLNAPDGAQNAYDFVQKNQFEDRGAQFFGDEGVLAQMNDKGAGGGIEQVDIQGALANLQERVEKKLGGKKPPIKNVKDLQAAMNAVIRNEQEAGRALIRIEDGQKVRAANPGIEEAMLALKMSPAEQKQVANALKQAELAVKDPVVIPGAQFGGHVVIPGVDDPKRGGDRLKIAKDIPLQGRLQRAGAQGDAVKPFIALQEGDPRRVGDVQAYQGMFGDQVREYMEQRQQANREKRIAALAKKGKGFKPDPRGEVADIRRMQEGNAFARIRADRAAAEARAQGRNEMGRLIEGKPVPSIMQPGSGQIGRARPPRPRPELAERPQFPPAPPKAEMDYMTAPDGPDTGARNRREIIKRIERDNLRRRAGIGAISAAGLATVLGLSNRNEEEEQV